MKFIKSPRTGFYSVRFKSSSGRFVNRRTGQRNLGEAKRIAKAAKIEEIEKAAIAGLLTNDAVATIIAKGKRITLPEAIDEVITHMKEMNWPLNTVSTTAYCLRAWVKRLKLSKVLVNNVTEKNVDAYLNARDHTGKSQRIARRNAIRQLYKFCIHRGYALRDPSTMVRINVKVLSHLQKEKTETVPMTEADYMDIMNNTTGFFHVATGLSYWTGLRLSDICNLEWDCFKPGEIVVWTIKRDKRVALPVMDPLIGSTRLLAVLKQIEQVHPQYVFPKEREIINDPKQRAKLSIYYGRILNRLGIRDDSSDRKSFHSLRHSFITRLNKAGKTLEEIGRLVGHSNTETTEAYNHQ